MVVHLSILLIGLLYSARISFAKDPLNQVVHPPEYTLPQCHPPYPYAVANYNKKKFEPCSYTFLLLTFSVHECPL